MIEMELKKHVDPQMAPNRTSCSSSCQLQLQKVIFYVFCETEKKSRKTSFCAKKMIAKAKQ
jgi:hypothetical protein